MCTACCCPPSCAACSCHRSSPCNQHCHNQRTATSLWKSDLQQPAAPHQACEISPESLETAKARRWLALQSKIYRQAAQHAGQLPDSLCKQAEGRQRHRQGHSELVSYQRGCGRKGDVSGQRGGRECHLAWLREEAGRWISMSEASGTTSGRKDSECGAIGVSSAHGTDGATMGPPVDREYAVEPDGVAIISPSACTHAQTTINQCSPLLMVVHLPIPTQAGGSACHHVRTHGLL